MYMSERLNTMNKTTWLYAAVVVFFIVLTLTTTSYTGGSNNFVFWTHIPLLLIWATAFYSLNKLQAYIVYLQLSPEEAGFKGLAKGCKWLVWGLPLTAILNIGLVRLSEYGDVGLINEARFISTYASLLLLIVAFSYMSKGTSLLMQKYTKKHTHTSVLALKQLILSLLGIGYSYLIISNLDELNLLSSENRYSIPVWALILSLVIPYLYVWFLGILTATDIMRFAHKTPGIIYRKGLHLLASGLILVVLSLMSVQYLKALIPYSGSSQVFPYAATIIVYSLCWAGFMMIAGGARKMQKVEEV